MSKIVGFHIYETQEEHDLRMREHWLREEQIKKQSRSRTRTYSLRRIINERAAGKCEICAFKFGPILIRHHIRQVNDGGTADPSNLILLCPNCHALVHNYPHYRIDMVVKRNYPGWKKSLGRAGLSEDQAETLLLVASQSAKVLPDGTVVYEQRAQALVPIIIDEKGEPIDPRFGPENLERIAEGARKVEMKIGGLQ